MTPYVARPDGRQTLYCGDARDVLAALPEASVHAVVTDPPYELGFMGKGWDKGGIAYSVALWQAVLRVLKPGGHLLAFGGTRTSHRMVCAIEDAGFEVRDTILWLYGSGFPKSLDVSKAIDKTAGAEREVVGTKHGLPGYSLTDGKAGGVVMKGSVDGSLRNGVAECAITAPATDAARQWSGWGTALKPACEPICVARKPLIGTVAENVLTHGTGAINVDGCRVGTEEDRSRPPGKSPANTWDLSDRTENSISHPQGRWPANVIHDGSEEVLAAFAQFGEKTSGKPGDSKRNVSGTFLAHANGAQLTGFGDTGTAARFFYEAKASPADRGTYTRGALPLFSVEAEHVRNPHPTVKPVTLMRYLIRLVTPPGGIVCDPFCGSGTTGVAAWQEQVAFLGIELSPDYCAVIQRRLDEVARKETP